MSGRDGNTLSGDPLTQVLAAREGRAALRRSFASGRRVLVSLSFNVPGWPKSDLLMRAAFDKVVDELTRYLAAHRMQVDKRSVLVRTDATGDFFLCALTEETADPGEVKQVAERFEGEHPLGRLLDVDVADQTGAPVVSGKSKPCLLCPDRPAVLCMRERRHPPAALRDVLWRRARAYLDAQWRETVCRALAQGALRAMLYEVSHTPKPGLVDRSEESCHRDMDYFSFLDSSAALAGFHYALAAAGYDFQDEGGDLGTMLPRLRLIGLDMEKAMFEATGGVNTHKGLIFLMSLALFAAGAVLRRDGVFEQERFRDVLRGLCRGMVARELGKAALPEPAVRAGETHGEAVYRKWRGRFGGGARAEAEAGFPMVFETGLPALESVLSGRPLASCGRERLRAALDAALYALMAVSPDTNVLHRGGAEALLGMQARAAAVRDSRDAVQRRAALKELFAYVTGRSLSPGGSGDLLTITLFVHLAREAFGRGL
ncbi:triphosphoribosyl-dephospho-CoA synthase [Desulfovibrio sp. JY]|nr:triphosphoribosyl-dephospho-CoA synthase [Desulfovibrio sp. JY]